MKQKLIAMGIDLEKQLGVAVSGGVDSMVLLTCLRCLNIPLAVYHMEHGIRGQQSKDDMEFVKSQCAKLGVECITKSVDVPALAKRLGASIETAARIARYEFLDAAESEVIATAHHMDDMAETMIMNLARGSGLSGLSGIPERRGKYIRPMLSISRDEIEKYAEDDGIDYVTDSTNEDTAHTRNYIRKEILPRLRKINNSAVANISRSAKLLCEDEDALDDIAGKADCIEVVGDGVHIDRQILLQQKIAVQKHIIRLAISSRYDLVDVENAHIDSILRLVQKGQSGKRVDLKYGLFAALAYDKLVVGKSEKKQYNNSLVSLPVQGSWQIERTAFECTVLQGGETQTYEQGAELFDMEVIAGAVLRHRQQGDYIVPLGMSGKKRLSDYLSDRKVPLHMRDDLLVMAKQREVFWVVGVGVSNASKVVESGSVIKINYWEK